MANNPVTALVLNCTLQPSPAPSSTDKLAGELIAELNTYGVQNAGTIRIADHQVLPGVEIDMGDGDDWPTIRQAIIANDILVLATPTWMGHMSSFAQRVLERLDAELSETDDQGRYLTYGKVACVVAVGNEDGAHHICADVFQGLNDVGFTLAANACTYWNDHAMGSTDYKDLTHTPKEVATATALCAANTAHLAQLLRMHQYPVQA